MNSHEWNRKLAAALAEDFAAVNFAAAGDDVEPAYPRAIVMIDSAAEDSLAYGNFELTVQVQLETIPADTEHADHSAWADQICRKVGDPDWLRAAMASRFHVYDSNEGRAEHGTEDGLRLSEISALVFARENQ